MNNKLILSLLGIMFYASAAFGAFDVDIINNTDKTVFLTCEIHKHTSLYKTSNVIKILPNQTIKNAVKSNYKLNSFNVYNDDFSPKKAEIYMSPVINEGKIVITINKNTIKIGGLPAENRHLGHSL